MHTSDNCIPNRIDSETNNILIAFYNHSFIRRENKPWKLISMVNHWRFDAEEYRFAGGTSKNGGHNIIEKRPS
jgi:hypothetical protein